jgi:hypothetical protein
MVYVDNSYNCKNKEKLTFRMSVSEARMMPFSMRYACKMTTLHDVHRYLII